MFRTFAALAFAAFSSAAAADYAGDYANARIGTAIDDLCHVLKYTERAAIERVLYDLATKTPEYQQDPEALFARLDTLDTQADVTAAGIGCSAAADSYITMLRDVASQRIYKDFLLADYVDRIPEVDALAMLLIRDPLLPDQKAATGSYAEFLKSAYGEQFDAFVEQQVAGASAELPPLDADPMTTTTTMQLAHNRARDTVRMVQFEVFADYGGDSLLRPHYYLGRNHTPALHLVGSDEPWAIVLSGPGPMRTDEGETVSGVFAITPAGGLRLLTYGTQAAAPLVEVKLLVRTASGNFPAGIDPFQIPEWRSFTTSFRGTKLDEKCLGAPCYAFPDAALGAIFSAAEGEYAELWLSSTAGAEPKPGVPAFNRNRVETRILWSYAR